jgi:hypothetical protein
MGKIVSFDLSHATLRYFSPRDLGHEPPDHEWSAREHVIPLACDGMQALHHALCDRSTMHNWKGYELLMNDTTTFANLRHS